MKDRSLRITEQTSCLQDYLNDAIKMHNSINKLVPNHLAGNFEVYTGRSSSVYRGTKLWDSLSYDIKTAKYPKIFCNAYSLTFSVPN